MDHSSGLDTANVIKTLWHGAPLSIFEELSLLSFVRQGHAVELYSYDEVGVPAGVQLKDANKIMGESEVFAYANGPAKGSFAAFSNLFRFKMLAQEGGIWSDLDVLCLRPFFDLPAAAIGQVCKFTPGYLNTAIIKAPAGNKVVTAVYEKLAEEGASITLGASSELLTQTARRFPDDCELLPVDTFYPLTWNEVSLLVDPEQFDKCIAKLRDSYAIHWWNTAITFGLGMPKDKLPSPGSFMHTKAIEIFGTDPFPAWPRDISSVWIKHFNHIVNEIGDIFVGPDVMGRIEKAEWRRGEVEVSGWAFDRSRPLDPLTIIFLLDGEVVLTQRTTAGRMDITEAYGEYRPRYVSFSARIRRRAAKVKRSVTDRILRRKRRASDLVVIGIGASGATSVIGRSRWSARDYLATLADSWRQTASASRVSTPLGSQRKLWPG